MYLLHPNKKSLSPLTNPTFASLGIKERQHLQEWLASTPETLGEELLIIQKEFDGFDETRERLDLLALDKQGRLVLIENKLDDSGRDVVWQALKYASYCANLSKMQIADIYQQYLAKHGGGNAKGKISEFMDGKDFEEIELNTGKQQRIILVAVHFRKEVTSTALWLLGHKVQIQCFKVTPWQQGKQVYLHVDQVIPPPENKDFLIALAVKEEETAEVAHAAKTRHQIRRKFWTQLLQHFAKNKFSLYADISPSKDHWLNAGAGFSGAHYSLIFGKSEARVQVEFAREAQEENKWLFDQMAKRKRTIESAFGAKLDWLRLDDGKSSRFQFAAEFDGYDEANWPAIHDWLLKHMKRLHKACDGQIRSIGGQLRQQGR